MSSSGGGKKRKALDSDGKANKKSTPATFPEEFQSYSISEVREQIIALCERVPQVPTNQFGILDAEGKPITDASKETLDGDAVREWATQLQAVIEQFNLLLCCVATATYKWGTDRSGAADQNLGLLSGELAASQDQIASTVTPRVSNVLAPVVDLVIQKSTKSKNDKGEDVKVNEFTRKLVDPDFYQLCHRILARNAPLLRQVVLSNFNKITNVLKDYMKAQTNDTQHSRGFTY